MTMMKAAILVDPGGFVHDDRPIPDIGPTDALMRLKTRVICGADVRILKNDRWPGGSSSATSLSA